MSDLLQKKSLGGLILAALAAGVWTMPAVRAQDSPTASKSPTQKNSGKGASTTAHSTNRTTTKKATATGAKKASSKKRSKKVKGQTAPTPERITEIQEALARNGAFNGIPTGKWDGSTVAAMRRFQASNGLNPTGKLDAPTLQKLGFGSETAGLAPPTPPPNAAGNRLLSRSAQRDELNNEGPKNDDQR